MYSNNIKKVIAVIIQKKNKLLLLSELNNKPYEKSKNKWAFPLGKVEDKEDILNAAYRELEEETGINNIFNLEVNGLFFLKDKIKKNNYILGVSFYTSLSSRKKINKESSARWIGLDRIKHLRLRENMNILIKNYENQIISKRNFFEI